MEINNKECGRKKTLLPSLKNSGYNMKRAFLYKMYWLERIYKRC
jgi:hypothetical protein